MCRATAGTNFRIYEIKTEDPVVLTHWWTACFPLKLEPDYKLLEYSCQEGNYVVPNWISTFRAGVRQAQASKRHADDVKAC